MQDVEIYDPINCLLLIFHMLMFIYKNKTQYRKCKNDSQPLILWFVCLVSKEQMKRAYLLN